MLVHLGLMLGFAQRPALRDPRSSGILHEAEGPEKGGGQCPVSCLWELLRSPGAGLDPVQLHAPAAGHPAPEASGTWSANLFQASATPKAKTAHRGSVRSARSCGARRWRLAPCPSPCCLAVPRAGAATVELPGLRDHSTGHLACPHFLPDLGSILYIGIKYSPQLPSLGQPAPSTSQVHVHRPAGHHSDSECRPP